MPNCHISMKKAKFDQRRSLVIIIRASRCTSGSHSDSAAFVYDGSFLMYVVVSAFICCCDVSQSQGSLPENTAVHGLPSCSSPSFELFIIPLDPNRRDHQVPPWDAAEAGVSSGHQANSPLSSFADVQ